MSSQPPKALQRLRVIDADTPDLETIDPTTLEFDDENRLCVVETVLALENSAEREAAMEERRRAYRKSYVLLKPSALAAYHAMSDALRGCEDELARRLGSTRSDLLLMSVRMPDDIWSDAFHAALKTLVPFITISHPGVDASFTVAIPQSERWQGTEYAFQPEPIMRELMKQHVVMLHGPGVDVPSTLSSLVDVSIDLADMPARYLELAIVRSFELDEPKIWLGPDVNRLKPSLFDAACARAPDWTEVAPILNRLARAELDEEAIAAKAKEKDEKKPSTSTSKTAFVPEVLHPTEPTLDILSGYGAFAEWAKDAARDIADYRTGRLAWSDVDVGCLLHGPPGTGKTFAARAFAATCGLPFMPVTYGQWTASGRSYQGDVIAAMRATFAAASALSPCVLFIDEVDSIPNREKVKEHNDYWIPIVNAKLELLDGTAGRPGVIVIAACNDPTRLDPALIRSGRLDRHFRLSLPDERSLLGMLGYHLPGVDTAALAPAATVLAGSASAADVARYAREARRAARRQNREVTAEDLLSIAMPVDTMSPRDRRLVAVHEAGHAVVAMDFGRMPGALSIVSANGAHGGVRLGSDIGMGRLSDFEAEAIISLAGRAAEEVILGEPSAGAEVDLQSATALVLQMIGTTGLGGRLTHGERVDAAAVEGRLRDLYSRAIRLVGDHRKAVESLADLAIERRVLGRAALVEFAREHGFEGAR